MQCKLVKRSVIIIGGGIAGLGAARSLARKGARVTLLEAAPRLGGRMYTIRHGKLPIELGAEFIHGRNKPLLRLIKDARLSAHKVQSANFLVEDGKLEPVDLWGDMEKVISRINPRRPDCSFTQFLEGEKLSLFQRQLAFNFAEGFNAAHADRISAHSLLKAQYFANHMDGDWQGRVSHGYGAVLQFLQQETRAHGVRMFRNARVRRVRWNPAGVEVAWRGTRGTEILSADTAILTLPLGVWKARTVIFSPPLPDKQAAAVELESGQVTKISLLFRERWWPKANEGFVHSPTEKIPTWWTDPRGPLLTGWTGGTKAEALLSFSTNRLGILAIEILARLFGEKRAALKRQLVGLYHHNWSRDVNFRGAYSYLPVNGLELPRVLAAPVAGVLFFAGEATTDDAQMGTVFGAYESGLRAAKEVLAVLK